MITGIYMFINKSNNKKYVGQSIDCHRRYTEHKRTGDLERYSAKNERDSNTPIHRAFQKYGFENFEYMILEKCSKEELNERERYWIIQPIRTMVIIFQRVGKILLEQKEKIIVKLN